MSAPATLWTSRELAERRAARWFRKADGKARSRSARTELARRELAAVDRPREPTAALDGDDLYRAAGRVWAPQQVLRQAAGLEPGIEPAEALETAANAWGWLRQAMITHAPPVGQGELFASPLAPPERQRADAAKLRRRLVEAVELKASDAGTLPLATLEGWEDEHGRPVSVSFSGHGQGNISTVCAGHEPCQCPFEPGCGWCGEAPPPLPPRRKRKPASPEDVRRTAELWSADAYARRRQIRRRLANAEAQSALELRGLPRHLCTAAARVNKCEGGGWVGNAATGNLVLHRESGKPIRQPHHCNHRLCPWCARRRSRAVRRQVVPRLEVCAERHLGSAAAVTMLTFTQDARPGESLADASERFQDSWGRLTRGNLWREHVAGAVVGFEVTLSTQADRKRRYARHVAGWVDAKGREHDGCGDCGGGELCREGERLRAGAARAASWWHFHAHAAIVAKPCDRDHCSTCTTWATSNGQHMMEAATGRTLSKMQAHRLWRDALDAETGGGPQRSGSRRPLAAETIEALGHGERASWLEHRELLAAWRKVGGGMVRIERGRSRKGALKGAAEVVKYLTKPIDLLGKLKPAELVELVGWLRGRRLLRTYGDVRGVDEEQHDEDDLGAELVDVFRGVVGWDEGTGELVTDDGVCFLDGRKAWNRAAALLVADAKGVDPPPLPPPDEEGGAIPYDDAPLPEPVWIQPAMF